MRSILITAAAALTRAAQFQVYFDNTCGGVNGSSSVGPFFSDICYTFPGGGQSFALTKCATSVGGQFEAGIFSDDKCTGFVQSFNATYGSCVPFTAKELITQVLPPGVPVPSDPSVAVTDASCTTTAAGKSYYQLEVYTTTGCGVGDMSDYVTIDGGNCVPNSLPSAITSAIPGYPSGQALYTITATNGATGQTTICWFESPSCGACSVDGGGRISLQFASVGTSAARGSCTGFPTTAQTGIPIVIPFFGLTLSRPAPYPPVAAPTPTMTPLPSPSGTPTPSGTPSNTPSPTLSSGATPSITPTGTPSGTPTASVTPTPSRSPGSLEGNTKPPATDPGTTQTVQSLVVVVAVLCVGVVVGGVGMWYRSKIKKEQSRRLARPTWNSSGSLRARPDLAYRTSVGLSQDAFGNPVASPGSPPPFFPYSGGGGGMASPLASSTSFRAGGADKTSFVGVPTQGL